MADLPDRPARALRLSARLFGGASGPVFRGMLTLALGSGAGRIIGIATVPVLTRLYGPEDFGALAVFTALIAILAPLVTLRYALTLPLPRHDGVAMNLLVLSCGLMLANGALLALALGVWSAPLMAALSMQVLAPWWWLIALGVLGTAVHEVLTIWATRRRAYRVIAQTTVTQSLAGATVKLGMGLAALQPAGLLVGQVVAQTGGIGRLLAAFRDDWRANWRHVRVARMRSMAWWYRAFPLWRVPSQLLMTASMQAPLLFMAALHDPGTVGQFGLAILALSVPLGLIGHSAAQAFMGEAAALGPRRGAEIRHMFLTVTQRLAVMAALPSVVLLALGPVLFPLVFGPGWEVAGLFAQALAISLLFQFVQTPVAHVFFVFDAQRQLFMLNAQRLALLTSVFAAGWALDLTAIQTVWTYALALSAHYALSVAYAFRLLARH